ncbi:uncharacterized protein [Lepeophtheirus salmonis]|uniref:uncharacterized protein n=1 Tax=Lepeophtheirus salmonis TaxID=72036 RepID=UPI001AE7EA64|nr:uncharacterized protein LOC121113573 [Lepeophtheirus salmonis]
MRTIFLGICSLFLQLSFCRCGIINVTNVPEQTTELTYETKTNSNSTKEEKNSTITSTEPSTTNSTDNHTKIATINENQLPYRNHEGVTITAPSSSSEVAITSRKDDDHYEDRDDYPPDWSIWAPSWSTPPIIEEEEEEDSAKLVIEEEETNEEGIPDVEESSYRKDERNHWYVLYMNGNEESIESSLKRQDFIDDLKLNLASRLAVRYEELHLNRLTSSGGQLKANFTIQSSHEKDLVRRLTDLVSKDVVSFSGEKFILNRIVKSDVNIPETHGLSHIHSYSHTTSLNSEHHKSNQDEQVELMLYLTIGGLCIFLFVLALSFLALQLVKSGSRNGGDEDYEDEDDDWKLLLTAVNNNDGSSGGGVSGGINTPNTPNDGINESSYSLSSSHTHAVRSYTETNHCNECELERQQTAKRQSVMNSTSSPRPEGRKNSIAALGNWTSKLINSFRLSGKYIDLNH